MIIFIFFYGYFIEREEPYKQLNIVDFLLLFIINKKYQLNDSGLIIKKKKQSPCDTEGVKIVHCI